MRAGRDDASLRPGVDHGLALLLVEPRHLAGELLAHRTGHGELEHEAAAHALADPAVDLAELAEIGNHPLADGTRYRDVHHHLEWRDLAGAARELAPVALRVAP